MFEELKKRSIKKRMFPAILLLIIGGAALVFLFPRVMGAMKGNIAFETLAPDEIRANLLVDITLDANFGCYIEEYEENTQTHYTRTTDLYYVIWTGDANATDYRYMGIKVPASDEKKMEAMAEATYYNEPCDPIMYNGEIQKMPDEDYEFLREYFVGAGLTEEEFEEYTLPYFINTEVIPTNSAVVSCTFAAFALLFVLIGSWMIISAIRGGRLKTFKKELADAGFGEAEADLEYQGARIILKPDDFRIGRRLTFFMIGSKPHVLLNDEIVWAYQKTTTHRTNGIKTGTTYSVVLNTIDKKKYESQNVFTKRQSEISVAGEQNALETLEYIGQTMPWVLLGFDNDLNRLYNKDCKSFLDIQYFKVDHNQLI